MPSDRELVHGVLAGDAQAFEALYERYQAPIERHLQRIAGSSSAAQDLLQEVFLRVWMRAAQWDERGTFRAWLYRIATNLALNHLRTIRRRREMPLQVPDEDEEDEGGFPAWMVDLSALGPDAALERTEAREQVRRLVASLPDSKRTIFRLVHEMEMTIRDAADELGIPEGTAKSRLHYARKLLASEWQAAQDT
jgi:RNA polymerase sigma-70 factor (ECF subfamily)